jgi:DNA-binding NarL/FixJ family response regulator
VLAGDPSEFQDFIRGYLRTTLSRIAQGTADEAIRVRWLTGPVGRELVELAGPLDALSADVAAGAADGSVADTVGPSLDDTERHLLQLLTEGRTNAEIATELGLAEDDVVRRLAHLFAQLGTSSRAVATSLAFRGLAAVGR